PAFRIFRGVKYFCHVPGVHRSVIESPRKSTEFCCSLTNALIEASRSKECRSSRGAGSATATLLKCPQATVFSSALPLTVNRLTARTRPNDSRLSKDHFSRIAETQLILANDEWSLPDGLKNV